MTSAISAGPRRPASCFELVTLVNKHNIKKLIKEQVAGRAKLQEMYNADYRLLSEEVHIVPRSLEHYINTDTDGIIIDFPWGPSDNDLQYILFTAVRILFICLVTTTKLFNVDITASLTEIDHKLTLLNSHFKDQ